MALPTPLGCHPDRVRRIGVEERRARLTTRQLQLPVTAGPGYAARAMVGLHSSDPATVYLSLWARIPDFRPADLEAALYEQRSLVRLLGMRRTMWVVDTDAAADVHNSSTVAFAGPERKRLVDMLERGGVTDDGGAWLESVSKRTLAAMDRLGEATARELSREVPELTTRITVYKKDGSVLGEFGASTRVLFQLAVEGLAVRARPLGTWLSSQYRWSTTANWLGPAHLEPGHRSLAQDAILERWLRTFGPGTVTDVRWWTGWPVTQIRASLERLGSVEVALDDGTGFVLADDLEFPDSPGSGIALLPSLDPTTMGWKQRGWYMGGHDALLFDSNGNAGPTVWADGRVIGGWAQRRDGEILYELFDDIGREARADIDEAAGRLQSWLGDTVVTARFRSPHYRTLLEK